MSIVIPTLNSGAALEECLASIDRQVYAGLVEVVVADGGSSDDTLEVAGRHGCVIVRNPLRTGEAGKAAGLKAATGDVIALIDSDNILPDPGWLERMTVPFGAPEIAGSEPLRYEHRRQDGALTRYCALLGMNDPLCYFLGNYDRYCVLSDSWTGFDITSTDRGGYLEVELEPASIPTMGANGFLVRRDLLDKLDIGDYLFDIDIVHGLVERGHTRFAKVKTGIVHIYGEGLATFARKQLRRIRDYRYYTSLGMRRYPWRQGHIGIIRFIIYCLLLFPLVLQALKGYSKVRDPAWALHVPACLLTLVIYTWGTAEGAVRPRMQARSGWKQ